MIQNLVAIDFSINSPAISIYNIKDEKYSFISFGNAKTFLNKKDISLSAYSGYVDLQNVIEVVRYERSKQIDDYVIDQRNKTVDAINLSKIVTTYLPPDSLVAIEGFSFASQSRSFIDTILFNAILRAEIIKLFSNIIVFSPSEIKRFATGSGTANKISMFNSFLNIENDLIKQTPFYNYCNTNQNKLIKKDELKKPFDDICDSIWILELLKNRFENNLIF